MNLKFILCGLLAATSTLCFGWSKDGEVPWRKIDDSLVTHHRKFATPVAGKKPAVMFFTCGIGQRELVELKQRFEYKYYLWPVMSQIKFSPFVKGYNEKNTKQTSPYAAAMTEEEYKSEEKKMLKEMDKCDLIVLGKFTFDAFPVYMRTRILNQIRAGKNMLIVCADGKDQKIPGVNFKPAKIDFPMNAIPTLAGTKMKMGTLGKGKILVICYKMTKIRIDNTAKVGAITPYESEDPLYYDYNLAFIGKIFWMMTDPDRAMIKSVSAAGKVVLKKNPPAGSKITYVVADEFGREIFKGKMKAAKNLAIKLPELPATARMLDVKLLTKGDKTIDFAVAPLKVKKAVTIKGFVLPKDGFKPDETITGKIELTAPAKNGVLKLNAIDNSGKEIYRKEFKVSGRSAVAFSAKILHRKSTYARLTAQLLLNGKFVDEARTNIYFDDTRDVSDFIFGMWSYGGSNTRISNIWLDQIYRSGVDTIMDAHALFASKERAYFIPRNLKRLGFRYAAYTTRLVGQWKRYGKCGYRYWDMYQKTGSVFGKNGKPLDGETRSLNVARGAKNIGVLFYNLGDENAAAEREQFENCFCEDCQRRFQNYLKRNHGTVAQLNKNYGTNYKDFKEVKGQSFIKSVEAGKLCEWVDYRLFMEEEFINWHLYHKAKVRTIDPEGRVGIEGLQNAKVYYGGYNLRKMMPHFEFCCPYAGKVDLLPTRQYLKGDGKLAPLSGAWFGSYEGEMNDQNIQHQPWRFLFSGLGSVFYWTSGNPARAMTYSTACVSRPDLKVMTQLSKAGEQVKIIKETGIGKIIKNSKPRYDEILIHFSNNNLHIATLNPDKSSWPVSQNDFYGILSGLGLGFRFIAPMELEKGIPAGTKVLVLPYSLGMSEKEVAAVRTFVKNGGLVITDYLPAVANQYGKFHEKSALMDVFGKFEKLHINRYGKGYAAYLEDYISGSSARIMRSEALGLQKGMLHILNLAGVKPFFTVMDENDKYQEISVFENGSDKYLCILAPKTEAGAQRKSKAGAEAAADQTAVGGSLYRKIKLAKPMHVYDIVNGNKYLGYIKEFSTNLQPAVGRPFICLEKPAQKPVISVKGFFTSSVVPGKAITFNVSGFDNTGILTVKDPSGKIRDVQRVTGKTARFIPAFNEPEGKWTAELKNAVGGLTATTIFHVK